jgi:putative membrane protein
MDWDRILTQLVSALVFGAAGVLLLLASFRLLRSVVPFSIAKEIAEDQNLALAILLGAAMIAIGIIVSTAIA